MATLISLSYAKARLAEVVHAVRTRGEHAVITIDGEPAVRIEPVDPGPRPLTSAETAGYRALLASLARIERPTTPFAAVELVGAGRR